MQVQFNGPAIYKHTPKNKDYEIFHLAQFVQMKLSEIHIVSVIPLLEVFMIQTKYHFAITLLHMVMLMFLAINFKLYVTRSKIEPVFYIYQIIYHANVSIQQSTHRNPAIVQDAHSTH